MPLEKGQAPLEKGQTYIEHFPAREDALLISESGCVPPEVMVLNTNPLVLFTISQDILIPYGQILKLSLDVRLESKRVRETARIISKVLKVSKETIRTRLRKQT